MLIPESLNSLLSGDFCPGRSMLPKAQAHGECHQLVWGWGSSKICLRPPGLQPTTPEHRFPKIPLCVHWACGSCARQREITEITEITGLPPFLRTSPKEGLKRRCSPQEMCLVLALPAVPGRAQTSVEGSVQHTHTLKHVHTRVYAHTCECMLSHTVHTYALTHAHSYTCKHALMRAHTCEHTNTCTPMQSHTCPHIHMQTCAHTRTLTHVQMCARTHGLTHRHTHTQLYSPFLLLQGCLQSTDLGTEGPRGTPRA